MRNVLRFLFLLCALGLPIAANAQKDYAINAIQGDKNTSPIEERTLVRLSGIVTARTRTGFFIQTPDDKVDSNPSTSEGIFVFTRDEPAVEAEIGNLVTVTGGVTEFRPRAEPGSLPITEITWQRGRDAILIVSKNNPLPAPIVLTVNDFASNKLDQLEKYEGMRVTAAELTVVSPTNGRVDNRTFTSVSDGVFYGIVKGLPKPFREPGYDLYEFVFLTDKEQGEFRQKYPKVSFFDTNPQRLRIESSAQLGSQPIDLPAFTELKNVTGVMHYGYRTYSILTDAATRPSVASYGQRINLPVPGERQFTVAGMNIENFFDDQDDPDIKEDIVTTESFNKRMKKISAAVRSVMQTPDVIGIVESENLAALKRLAERINADALAAGKPDPKYEAFLVEGNDGRGIDNGFLVKTSRVKVVEVKQFGKNEKYKNPDTGQDNFLNDRPPLMLRIAIDDAKTGKPFAVTLIVNHLKSFLGYDDPKQMANVRLKKVLQAYYLGGQVRDRLKVNPAEKIVLLGDFNAYQFNDGVMDVIGTIKGTPPERSTVMMPSDDLIDSDLIDLVDLISVPERYSYRYDGNAQVLDHIIVTNSLKGHVHGFGYARVNADFPESYRNDENRPERFSDHDAAVAYFDLDGTAAKPTATPQP